MGLRGIGGMVSLISFSRWWYLYRWSRGRWVHPSRYCRFLWILRIFWLTNQQKILKNIDSFISPNLLIFWINQINEDFHQKFGWIQILKSRSSQQNSPSSFTHQTTQQPMANPVAQAHVATHQPSPEAPPQTTIPFLYLYPDTLLPNNIERGPMNQQPNEPISRHICCCDSLKTGYINSLFKLLNIRTLT